MATGIPVSVGELVDVPTINSWARGYLRKNTAKAVNATTSPTDLLNGEFTLPAGAMGTTKVVRLTAWGDWLQHVGADKPIPGFQLLLGGTTLLEASAPGVNVVSSNTTRQPWRIVCEIQNLAAANSQRANFAGRLLHNSNNIAASGVFLTGEGLTFVNALGSSGNGWSTYDGTNATAVDTTASCALLLNAVNSYSDANYETTLYGALVEII